MEGKKEMADRTVMIKWIDPEVGQVCYECEKCGNFAVQLDPPAFCPRCGKVTEQVKAEVFDDE